ncbi:sigma 54-interacting transcriptional regulator [bacterium]|nr:sigma 54-interacting transcriptional regulator [bacterium]
MSVSQAHLPQLLPGISAALAEINQQIQSFADDDLPVLITGETGTEKSFAAKLLHHHSHRASRPIAKISITWKLPSNMGDHLRTAADGTLVINLQREFPIDLQYLLLELVNDRGYEDPTLGRRIKADVRIVLTSHEPELHSPGGRGILPELRELLGGHHVNIPPIRERPEDIPALVRYATARARETGRSNARGADAQVLALFRQWRWPGNSEDLLLVTAEAALNAKAELISLDDLPEEFLGLLPPDLIEEAREVRLPRVEPPVPVRPVAEAPKKEAAPTGLIGEPLSEEEQEERAQRLQRLVTLARRLNAQSQILARQMAGPIAGEKAESSDQFSMSGENILEMLPDALEAELDRGIDSIMALRRQVALLNRREADAVVTVRDIYRRFLLAGEDTNELMQDGDIIAETEEVADNLREIDGIIQRVSKSFPKLGEQLQASVTDNISEEDTKMIERLLEERAAAEREREEQEKTQS